jgi:predicted anti-sigma-YlaC factor YlaD
MAGDCARLRAVLGEYLDEELDPELCRLLEEHLQGCNPCRVVVDTTRRTIEFYSGQRPVELPPEVRRRLQERLKGL